MANSMALMNPSALLRLGSSSWIEVNKSAILTHPLQREDTRKMMGTWICFPGGEKQKAVMGGAKATMGKYKGTQMREKQLTDMIEKKVIEAKEVCGEDKSSDECKVAWDEVEEVSQAKADLRLKLEMQQDPLESFCQDYPETDECRIYED